MPASGRSRDTARPGLSTAERDARRDDEWSTYSLYGLTLATDFVFANRLASGARTPELTFTCVPSSPFPHAWEQAELVYTEPPRADGKSDVLLYRSGDCWILRFRTADFYLWPDRILCHLQKPKYRYLAEIQLLGVVLACWLERRGTPALHASAVVVDDRAVAFLSTQKGGKSSLAATLMQAGCPLLTDDILPVERSSGAYVGHPGYPQMRMWPDQARHFSGHYEDLDLVHPAYTKRRVPVEEDGLGNFCEVSQPLACVYLPERRDPVQWGTRIQITPVPPLEGLMALIRNSFVAPVVEALGLQPGRLGFFTRMISQIPIRRFAYPNGLDLLPHVRQAILDDLADLPRSEHRRLVGGS